MHRRDFLALAAAVSVAMPLRARAQAVAYTPGLVDQRLAAGETLFVDFKASWCSTCAAQERVIGRLLQERPEYARRITFVSVDWDLYRNDDLTQRLNIPRRSTLVVLKGDRELGRIVAGTARAEIAALLDTALAAAA